MSISDRKFRDPDIAPDLLAHDLRAAAAGIISSLGLITDDNLSSAERRNLLQARVSAATLKDLLDISMGVEKAPARRIPLDELARRIDNRWRGSIEDRGLSLHVHRATDAPESVFCAMAELHRIFDNILGNALKFCESGCITVGFAGDRLGGIRVTIDDDGPGFSDAALRVLYEFRGRPENAEKSGSGLGLFIAKSLIDRIGGDIQISNRDQGGARVILSLPEAMCDPDGAALGEEATPAKTGTSLPDLSAFKILVAEDNLTNQLVVGQMLETMGAKFDMASDGVEALEKFEQGHYDLLLLDIEMPRMTGLEVIRRIRARNDGREHTPLLALTAYAMPDHVRRIKDEGVTGLIPKPLTSLADFGAALLKYGSDAPHISAASPAEAETAQSDLSEIDRELFDSLATNMGADVMRDLLHEVANDLGNVHEQLRLGRLEEDVDAIRSATHILISLAGAIGGVNLQYFAQALNARVKTTQWQHVCPDIDRAITGVESMLSFVAKEIRT